MPPRQQLDKSDYRCPECGCGETYVNAVNDQFLCAECDYSAPIAEVADK